MELYRQASRTTKEVIAIPPKYLGMYGDFVTKNASAVGQIEGALRSLTYIIPGMLLFLRGFMSNVLMNIRSI